MTAFDDKMVATALRLIDKYGTTFTVADHGIFNYDPNTGSGIQTSAAPTTITAVAPFPYDQGFVDHDLIQTGDARTWVAASGLAITLKVGMIITVGPENWRVVSIRTVFSGGSVVLYELQLRGGAGP